MAKFTVLGAMYDDRSIADVLAYAFTYEDAKQAISEYQLSDESMVEYDFYFIEEA